jgi:AraC-like DNA-binding protein
VDPLSALLDAPRARDAFVLRVSMARPWAIRVQDEAALTVVAMARGSSVWQRGDETFPLGTGDVVLLTGTTPYVVGDEAGRAPFAIIQPGNVPETPDRRPLSVPLSQGVRTWGNSPDGPDAMLVGNYGEVGEAGRRLLSVLPPTVVLRASEWRSPLVPLLLDELDHEGVGQASLLDRLLDALVVSAVRQWAVSRGDAAPAWLDAAPDPVVADALTLLHDRPGDPWSLVTLARAVGVSRAALARRFRERVGESPIAYLTGWRMALAADRLRGGTETVARIAAEVGYPSPFSFSAAFKRVYGLSPSAYRSTGRASLESPA